MICQKINRNKPTADAFVANITAATSIIFHCVLSMSLLLEIKSSLGENIASNQQKAFRRKFPDSKGILC